MLVINIILDFFIYIYTNIHNCVPNALPFKSLGTFYFIFYIFEKKIILLLRKNALN